MRASAVGAQGIHIGVDMKGIAVPAVGGVVLPEKKSLSDPLQHLNADTTLYSDGMYVYRTIVDDHEWVDHASGEYVRGSVHTNSVEGFFGIMKRAACAASTSTSGKST